MSFMAGQGFSTHHLFGFIVGYKSKVEMRHKVYNLLSLIVNNSACHHLIPCTAIDCRAGPRLDANHEQGEAI